MALFSVEALLRIVGVPAMWLLRLGSTQNTNIVSETSAILASLRTKRDNTFTSAVVILGLLERCAMPVLRSNPKECLPHSHDRNCVH